MRDRSRCGFVDLGSTFGGHPQCGPEHLVILSEAEAERLGLQSAGGAELPVETASGRVSGRRIFLDRVRVGGLELTRVEGVVLPGYRPMTALLGMSFLGRMDMRNEGSVLVLQVR